MKLELSKRDQEILALGAKMKTLEEQHQDYQRHIAVLKESLIAKEEHYSMLQADVSVFFLFVSIWFPIIQMTTVYVYSIGGRITFTIRGKE